MTDEKDVNGASVTLYTADPCGFCRMAKALLDKRGYRYEEVNVTKNELGRERLFRITGQLTFPQVLVGERSLGGFRELLEADRDGTLEELLEAA